MIQRREVRPPPPSGPEGVSGGPAGFGGEGTLWFSLACPAPVFDLRICIRCTSFDVDQNMHVPVWSHWHVLYIGFVGRGVCVCVCVFTCVRVPGEHATFNRPVWERRGLSGIRFHMLP